MTVANAGELALALQSARGTPASTSTQRTNVVAMPLAPDFGLRPNPELRAARMAGTPSVPSVGVLGDVEIVLRPKIAGLLLYAALGAKSVSGASDPWSHVFTMVAGVLPWLTAWRSYGAIEDERYSDARISKLVISSSAGGPVRARASLVAGSVAYRTAQETTAAVESADFFLHRHGASALLVEGVSFSSIREWILTIDTGVALEHGLGGPMPRMAGLASVSLDILHVIADAALWRRMIFGSSSPSNLAAPAVTPLTLAGSPVGAQFTLTAASSPERSLRISLPSVALAGMIGFEPMTALGPGIVRTSLLGYGTTPTLTLKNSQSSY